jgi:hypothetical protein|tara:strand:- start:551 stop:1015 length:465 start_codon:yes stop_codon:yes gene_type:complete
MASATTRSTLGSGSMLGIMNVLMQLRKVCNHPDLFEERSIRSPHQMGPLLMQTAAFVTRALLSDAGPMADVSFFVILFWIFWSLRGVCFSYAFKHVLLLVLTSELYAFISSMFCFLFLQVSCEFFCHFVLDFLVLKRSLFLLCLQACSASCSYK